MSFTSLIFPVFLVVYLLVSALLPTKAWKYTAIIASGVFYGYWDIRFLLLIYSLVGVTWFAGERIASTEDQSSKKRWVTISIVWALGVLAFFKYFNFFTDVFVDITALMGVPLSPNVGRIILPVGISFYTFQALSYTIDLYRGKIDRPASLVTFTAYLSFFPQLVAGPIVRASRFIPQIERGPRYSERNFLLGGLLIAWGYFLKLCLADFIALAIDPIFATPATRSSADLVVGLIGYSFQIYGDFAGYSLIAIGVAKLQGFHFPANFNLPYVARSFGDFWRRWHISLSTWLRDYLYFPLGGSRGSELKTHRNLMLTMLLGGLWHGASYNFVLWGGLHGVYLSVERKLRKSGWRLLPSQLPRMPRIFLTWLFVFSVVAFTRVFFRIEDFDVALVYVNGLTDWTEMSLRRVTQKFEIAQVFTLIAFTASVEGMYQNKRRLARLLRNTWGYALVLAFLITAIQLIGNFGGGAFIYFQF